MDIIFIKNLEISTKVGVTEKERGVKQTVIVDLYIYRDLKPAGLSDNPRKTSSYSKIRDGAIEFVSKGEFKLLESIAEGLANVLLEKKAISKVKVRIRKKRHESYPSLGIEIVRTRNE